jgi:phosphatidate cytidylyltransferase
VLWWAVQAASLARPGPIVAESAPDPGLFAAGILILASPWAAMVELHGLGQAGPALVLLLVLLVWTADSLAYFAGRRFGRTKLAPLVSPGKTREGVYAALAGGLLWGLPLGWLTGLDWRGTGLAALVCLVAVAASVVGDLYESLQKRRRGMKDAGSLLPGHGGMLDRVDSLTAAAPVFALGIALVGGLA